MIKEGGRKQRGECQGAFAAADTNEKAAAAARRAVAAFATQELWSQVLEKYEF